MTPAERHKALRKAKQELKRRLAVPCPHCASMPVGPPPSMLLPQELCKMHGYRDPRPRRPEDDYQLIGRDEHHWRKHDDTTSM